MVLSRISLQKFRISIVITSYNQRDYLNITIQSALHQTHKPHEIIITDDASTDGSKELIQSYAKKYPQIIRPILNQKNTGVSVNRNAGFKLATGDLVTWANGDDILLPHKLEYELKTYHNNPEARWVYSQVFYVDEFGRRTGVIRYNGKHRKKPYTLKDVVTKIGKEPAYQLMERSLLDKVGLFDDGLEIYEDWDFAIRLAKYCRGAYCPTPLYEYRQYKGGLSSSNKPAHLRAVKKVYQNVLPLLNDINEKEAFEIKKFLNAEICGLDAAVKIKQGKRLLAGKSVIKAVRNKPKEIFFFELGMMCLFPDTLLNALRAFKQKYLPNMR